MSSKPTMQAHSVNGALQPGCFGYSLKPGMGFNPEGVDAIHFWCPGKNRVCVIPLTLGEASHPRWHWDGNMESPTIAPSIGCDNPPRCGAHVSIINGEIRP